MKFYAHTAANKDDATVYSFNRASGVGVWQGTDRQFFDKMGRKFSGVDLAEDQSGWQSLEEHLLNVALLAAGFVHCIGLSDAATALGWLHDLGKYNPEFQRYLRSLRGKGEDTRHAIHGAALLLSQPDRALVQAVAGHHAGLYDWSNLEPGAMAFGRTPPLQSCYETWKRETGAAFALPDDAAKLPPPEAELRTRMLFSALVDADRLDTEQHRWQNRSGEMLRGAAMPMAKMAHRLEAHLDGLRSAPAGSPVPELTRLRQQISDDAYAKACHAAAPGVFSLTVPTGGGKTLASLRFALQHAVRQGFDRVIYVIPFTSIIEQNAKVFAGIFGAENVLEHHSLAAWRAADDNHGDDADIENDLEVKAVRKRLAAENWDASLVVTTNVQFFESLCSHRPASCRKLHRLLNSVIIFDECQAFPPGLLDPTLRRLQALAALGRTSLVLCTATQPAFRRRPAFPEGFEACEEIMPDAARLARQPSFQRTRIVHDSNPRSLDDLCDELREAPRVLAIFNTRRDAAQAYRLLGGVADGEGDGTFHLSTLLCPRHREYVLARVRVLLATPGARCQVVSTQLVEAGVDIDFPLVYRALGPLDAIIQAAGRCNREGKLAGASGLVHVFQLEEENLPGGTYKRGRDKAPAFLARLKDASFVEPALISEYFAELYPLAERDCLKIAHLSEGQRYRTLGETYRWIDDDGAQSVVTNYGEEGRALQEELRANMYAPPDRKLLRKLGPFSINLRMNEIQKGLDARKIERLENDLYLTQCDSYHPITGYDGFSEASSMLMV